MTGKQLKAWASEVPDEAIIQIDKGYSVANWEDVELGKLRAYYVRDIRPTISLDDCNNLEVPA